MEGTVLAADIGIPRDWLDWVGLWTCLGVRCRGTILAALIDMGIPRLKAGSTVPWVSVLDCSRTEKAS